MERREHYREKSYLDEFELHRVLERETLIDRTLLSSSGNGVISSGEWEKKPRELDQNQHFTSS